MFNVQGFYRSKGTLSNLTSRTDWNLPGSSGTLRVNTSEPSRAPQVTRTIQTSPKSSCGNSCNPPRSPTSSFSNSPIPLEPSNCTPELCRTLRSFCNIALQSLKIRTFLLQSFKKKRQPGSSCMVHDFNVNLESISYGRNWGLSVDGGNYRLLSPALKYGLLLIHTNTYDS